MLAKLSIAILLAFFIPGLWVLPRRSDAAPVVSETADRNPILVELFTSEGCSSCPPADRLLEKFDSQPIAGAQLIVLSEHVDYWNHIGWTDPYSSALFSQRQSRYGDGFHLASVYTPQMVVDGNREFVGSSDREARAAFAQSQAESKVALHIQGASVRNGSLHAQIETGSLPQGSRKADVVVVVALSHAESEVARGENAGRRLTHVAVVRTLQRVATLSAGQSFNQEVTIPVERGVSSDNLRVVAFLQLSGQGRVLGAAESGLSRSAKNKDQNATTQMTGLEEGRPVRFRR